jgi:hypothetical protein
MRETKQQLAERVARDNAVDYTGKMLPNGFGGTATVIRNLGTQEGMGGWDLYEVDDAGIVKRWTSAVLFAITTREN